MRLTADPQSSETNVVADEGSEGKTTAVGFKLLDLYRSLNLLLSAPKVELFLFAILIRNQNRLAMNEC